MHQQIRWMWRSGPALILATVNAIAVSTPPVTPAHYDVTTFEIPGSTFIGPFGPSAQGLVCGFFVDQDGGGHAFLWQGGEVKTIEYPGGANTEATGLNDRGEVVGGYYDSNGAYHNFVYNVRKDAWQTLPDVPGLPLGANLSINNAGLIASSSFAGTQGNTGWTWDGQQYSFFTVPGADESSGNGTNPLGINERGQITGLYQDASGSVHGFIKGKETYTTLDVPGADATWAFSTNNSADTVGTYYLFTPEFQEKGFLLHKGKYYTFPIPGPGGLTTINDRGQIAGTYVDDLNTWHGFVATPLP